MQSGGEQGAGGGGQEPAFAEASAGNTGGEEAQSAELRAQALPAIADRREAKAGEEAGGREQGAGSGERRSAGLRAQSAEGHPSASFVGISPEGEKILSHIVKASKKTGFFPPPRGNKRGCSNQRKSIRWRSGNP